MLTEQRVREIAREEAEAAIQRHAVASEQARAELLQAINKASAFSVDRQREPRRPVGS
ncbi:hypothetical protein [Marinicauda sp. Alg238-R41]|uniref:hypothetical protein n=1 Tax=Marinicauda sp. Alg238-R41 TaxID=2993447 RepID=UPI0022DF1A5D|nr:hypothetical protein [Marinicauda sp. Alg238-R41]